jgi:hypothetical protein
MNVIDLVRRHGIEPRRTSSHKGGEYHSVCPDCGDSGHDPKTGPPDRFMVFPQENEGQGSYYCRKCNRGGDAIQFLRDFDGMSFRQACEALGRDLPDSKDLRIRQPKAAGADWIPRDPAEPEELWREKAKALVLWAYEQLIERRDIIGWLEARGISEETATTFILGWIPDDLYRARESWGQVKVKNEQTGKDRPLWIPRGLVIPWFDGEHFVKLRIRRPDPVKLGPRYYMVPGSASVTTISRPSRKGLVQREVYVIVESELDAIMIHEQAGDVCGAVALGSNSAHPDVAAEKILKEAAVILNALDFDAAGSSQSEWWIKHFPLSKRWPVPEGKDPGEAYQRGVDIREWIRAGLPEGLRSAALKESIVK